MTPSHPRSWAAAIAVVLIGAELLGLQGCSIMPGMYASFDKPVVIDQTPEEPDSNDYTLFKITRKLVRDMDVERRATEQKIVSSNPLLGAQPTPYKLGPQDVLQIYVWGQPDLSPMNNVGTMNAQGGGAAGNTGTPNSADSMPPGGPGGRVINEKGEVYFPLVGTLRAAGMTVSEFRDSFTRALRKYIKNPQVDVNVAAYRSQKIFIAGEVKLPGFVSITEQPLYVLGAIARAGGNSAQADLTSVLLTRGKISVTLDLDKVYYGGDLANNVLLQDGDLLTLPDRESRKVFVLGDLNGQPKSYVMRRGQMTLAEVLSDAGGPSVLSSAGAEVYLLRADENKKPLVYQLDAKEPQALILAEQFRVQARDVVFVNPTGPARIGRIVSQFFPFVFESTTIRQSGL